jgi:phage protein D
MPETQSLVNQVYLEIGGMSSERAVELMGDLVTLTVESSLHLPDVATIIVHDSKLEWIDEPSLEPGKEVKVSAKTGDKEQALFDGEIFEIEPDFAPHAQRFVIRAFDRMHRLSRGHKARSFVNVTDGDVVNKLAKEVGLQASVGQTSQVHPYLFQNNQTNLEFLRSRAAALGFVIYVEGKTLHFKEPKADGGTVDLQWAQTLMEFHPRMSTAGQVSGTVVRGWDPEKKQEIIGRAQQGNGAPSVGESRAGGALAQSAFNIDASAVGATVPVRDQGRADAMAKAMADRRASRFIEADGVSAGDPRIVAGTPVKVLGVGNRFSGTYVVTSCRHEYKLDKTFVTHFSISGQNPSGLLAIVAPHEHGHGSDHGSGRGLVIGIVTDNDDPNGQGRVKVKYPALAPDQASDWARVVSVGGGAERGIAFIPEINDEVLVGFEQGDIHHPYVLGGLWNGVDKPAVDGKQAVTGGKVQQRVIKTRVGHKITLDDTDGGGGITIEDKSGNKVKLDTGSNALKIEVKGDASIEAQGNLKFKATGSVEISGMGVKVDGGGAMVDIKGSMVNLN